MKGVIVPKQKLIGQSRKAQIVNVIAVQITIKSITRCQATVTRLWKSAFDRSKWKKRNKNKIKLALQREGILYLESPKITQLQNRKDQA